jgi:hypothetical protein
MPLTMFVTLNLTESEAKFIRDNMRLTCMNESGPAADIASRIERLVSSKLRAYRPSSALLEVFGDLYPEGRE